MSNSTGHPHDASAPNRLSDTFSLKACIANPTCLPTTVALSSWSIVHTSKWCSVFSLGFVYALLVRFSVYSVFNQLSSWPRNTRRPPLKCTTPALNQQPYLKRISPSALHTKEGVIKGRPLSNTSSQLLAYQRHNPIRQTSTPLQPHIREQQYQT